MHYEIVFVVILLHIAYCIYIVLSLYQHTFYVFFSIQILYMTAYKLILSDSNALWDCSLSFVVYCVYCIAGMKMHYHEYCNWCGVVM